MEAEEYQIVVCNFFPFAISPVVGVVYEVEALRGDFSAEMRPNGLRGPGWPRLNQSPSLERKTIELSRFETLS